MYVDFLLERFNEERDSDALIWRDQTISYGWIVDTFNRLNEDFDTHGIEEGSVISLESDFSPLSVAMLLVLMNRGCIIVPLTDSVESKKPEFRDIAEIETTVRIDSIDEMNVRHTGHSPGNEFLVKLKERGHPGLVLFSSGSTGKSKAALHDFVPMLRKFEQERHTLRTITFLLFDHIGGINTLLYNLSNTGCVVTVSDRHPAAICKAIEKYRVQLLPTSPTFLNLLLVSRAYENHDLSSLELVTYGTEVMPEKTLERFHKEFPDVRLLQTYGLSEVGILRSKSRSSDSLWVKVGGEGFETRVVDGLLEIKAESSMLGYLNAPDPFTDDGWFRTGDAVEVDGEYIKILGRRSEIINVGGEKVYPAEIEGILQTMDDVEDAAVTGESNAITGQAVVARVKLLTDETLPSFRKRMREHFKDLPRFKMPQKVILAGDSLHGTRFKKMRNE